MFSPKFLQDFESLPLQATPLILLHIAQQAHAKPKVMSTLPSAWLLGTLWRHFCTTGEILNPSLVVLEDFCLNSYACREYISSPDFLLTIWRGSPWLLLSFQCASWQERCRLYILSTNGHYSRGPGWEQANEARNKTVLPVRNCKILTLKCYVSLQRPITGFPLTEGTRNRISMVIVKTPSLSEGNSR